MGTPKRQQRRRGNASARKLSGAGRRRQAPASGANPFHLPTWQFSYIGRSHHTERASLREVLRSFGIEESPYARQLIDYWDRNRSDLYLLALRSIAG